MEVLEESSDGFCAYLLAGSGDGHHHVAITWVYWSQSDGFGEVLALCKVSRAEEQDYPCSQEGCVVLCWELRNSAGIAVQF